MKNVILTITFVLLNTVGWLCVSGLCGACIGYFWNAFFQSHEWVSMVLAFIFGGCIGIPLAYFNNKIINKFTK